MTKKQQKDNRKKSAVNQEGPRTLSSKEISAVSGGAVAGGTYYVTAPRRGQA